MLPYWRLSAYYFFYFAFIGAFSPYFGLYLAAIGFSPWHIGVLMSLMQVMRLVAPNVWGWLADRRGAGMPIVRLAALASTAGFASFLFTRSFEGMFAGMALMSFFWSAALPLVESYTLSHLGNQPGRYGGIRLWGSVGFIAAVLAVGYVLDAAPIGSLLWIILGILAGILACALAIPDRRGRAGAATPAPLRDVLARPEVRALLAACFLMSAAHGALYVFYSIYLVAQGYGKGAVGWLWTLGVLAEILVFLYMPQLLRTFSLRAILIFSFGCAVVRFLLIGWFVEQPWVMVVAQLLHGATFGAYHAAAVAAINRWFTGSHQARGQALYGSVSFGAGGMVGGVLSGYTWETLGPAITFSLGSLFALAGLLLVLQGWRSSVPEPATP